MDKNSQEYWDKLLEEEGLGVIDVRFSNGPGTNFSVDLQQFTTCDLPGRANPKAFPGASSKEGLVSVAKNWASRAYVGAQGVGRDTRLFRLILQALDRCCDLELIDMLFWRYYNQRHRDFTEHTGRSRKYLEKWRMSVELMIEQEEVMADESCSMTLALDEWLNKSDKPYIPAHMR